MYLKSILIIICSAILFHDTHGAENKPGDWEEAPDFPEVCEGPESPPPYKERGAGTRRKLQVSQYNWKDYALCSINQPGK